MPVRALHIPFFALPVAPELLFRLGGRRVVDASFALLWKADTSLSAEALAEYRAAYTRPAVVQAMLGYYRAATRPRLARLVTRSGPRIPVPRVRTERALVLWGTRDPILPVSTGESVVRDLGPECVMVTVPGAGHFVVEEAPDVVADVLLDFLGDAAVARPAAPPEKPDHPPVEPPPAVLEQPPLTAPRKAPAKKKKKAPSPRVPPSTG